LLLLFRPFNRGDDKIARVRSAVPVANFHPLAWLEVFVVLKEMFDLLQRNIRDV
jgi:hypothetical protein